MGGRIGVESEVGKGVCFWFNVHVQPASEAFVSQHHLADSKNAATRLQPIEALPERLRHKRILVAEDNAVNQMVVKGMLNKINIEFDFANDGAIAVEKYRDSHQAFDLILMDCEMPNMDGFEATRAIRAFESQHKRRPIPIVALTAHVMQEHQEKSVASGMNGHLAKPLELERLRETLLTLLA